MNTNKATKIALKSGLAGSAKDILMSIIGTTISIILTFGTSSLIDHYQEKKARKLFAMTIIHEIDQDIELVKKYAVETAELHNLNQFIRRDLNNQFVNIPKDSLVKFYNLLNPNKGNVEFSKSNEQIFNSNQNTWSTIDNNIFITNIQKYYQLRSNFEHNISTDTCFNSIISYKEYQGKGSVVDGHYVPEDNASVIKRLYNESPLFGVRVFITSSERLNVYNQLLEYKSVNEENKILMGISDKDLEEFANRTAEARNVSENDMIGSWIGKSYTINPSWGNHFQTIFTFHKNNTITIHANGKGGNGGLGIGDIFLYCNITGDWKIKNDSLVMTFPDDKFEMRIDDNDFYYSNISQLRNVENENKNRIISSIGRELGAYFTPNECNTVTVTAHIDRFNRAITLRTFQGKEPKRFERTDPAAIKTCDFEKHSATEQEITGKWAWYEDVNTVQMEFQHRKNHSLAIMEVDKEQNPDLFTGTLRVKRNLSGEWKLENDSLVYYYDTKTLDISFDDSGISVVQGKENLLGEFKRQLSDTYT